jgi:hypothetical protein
MRYRVVGPFVVQFSGVVEGSYPYEVRRAFLCRSWRDVRRHVSRSRRLWARGRWASIRFSWGRRWVAFGAIPRLALMADYSIQGEKWRASDKRARAALYPESLFLLV